MPSLGYKIVDKEERIFLDLLEDAFVNTYAVELGLYGESERVREAFATLPSSQKNMHFNHYRYTLIELQEKEALLREDIATAHKLGAPYAVHHIAKNPMTRRKEYQPQMMAMVLDALKRAEEICVEEDFTLYVENTYEPLTFYWKLFETLHAEEYRQLQFCFDIGHAKIWSDATFDEWMLFLGKLEQMGFEIHFHLHANRGLLDEHLSFVEMEALGFDGNDYAFSDNTYAQMLEKIMTRFPQNRKIFEVKSQYAIENMQWVEAQTLALKSGR